MKLPAALALGMTLTATPSYAQALGAPAQQPGAKPAAPAPAPAQPPAAITKPPAPATVTPAQLPNFRDGLKYAYVNVQYIAQESNEGKALATKIKAFTDQKQRELQEKNKALQTAQQKLEQGATVLSEQARAQLQGDIERQQRDIQRFTEDAQQDITNMTQQAQDEFGRKLLPFIDKVAKEKGIDFVFNAAESGLIWASEGMNLTGDVIKSFDAGAAAKPAAAPVVTPKP